MNVFQEKDGSFSYRKVMTIVTIILFAIAVIGFLITHNFDELPTSYTTIIAGVFVFYFGKRLLEGRKITMVENQKKE